MALDIRVSGGSSSRRWAGYVVPVTELRVRPDPITAQCQSGKCRYITISPSGAMRRRTESTKPSARSPQHNDAGVVTVPQTTPSSPSTQCATRTPSREPSSSTDTPSWGRRSRSVTTNTTNNYLAVQCVTIVCQVFYRRCNLRELCHCAVAVRAGQLIVTFDICTRGYLQASIPHSPAL